MWRPTHLQAFAGFLGLAFVLLYIHRLTFGQNGPAEVNNDFARFERIASRHRATLTLNGTENNPDKKVTCSPKKTYFKCCNPLTALASFPGSGNHWLRYLLEEATGYYTGSVYPDPGRPIRMDGRALAVKTHQPMFRWRLSNYTRIILLMRSPFNCFVSEFNRAHGGHVGLASPEAFQKDWEGFFTDYGLRHYGEFHSYWLSQHLPVHIVQYESLQGNLKEELEKLIRFLGLEVNEERLDCVLHHPEGSFHRPARKKPFDVKFTDSMREKLETVVSDLEKLLKNREETHLSGVIH